LLPQVEPIQELDPAYRPARPLPRLCLRLLIHDRSLVHTGRTPAEANIVSSAPRPV